MRARIEREFSNEPQKTVYAPNSIHNITRTYAFMRNDNKQKTAHMFASVVYHPTQIREPFP